MRSGRRSTQAAKPADEPAQLETNNPQVLIWYVARSRCWQLLVMFPDDGWTMQRYSTRDEAAATADWIVARWQARQRSRALRLERLLAAVNEPDQA